MSSTALAVPLTSIPASSQASRAAQQIQQQSILPTKTVSTLAVTPLPTPTLSKEAGRVHFTLKGVIIEGNTVYPQADLYWVFRNYLDHDVTLAQLYEIAQQITLKYHNDGYMLSKAYLPPQSVKDGIVHVRIVEGYVDRVVIEGNAPNSAELLQAYGNHVVNSGPLRMQTLERYTLLANDLPGFPDDSTGKHTVRAILRPSTTTPGAATLVFVANEKRYEGYANYNNRGTRFLGPNQFLFGGALNNIFRSGDETEVRYANTLPLKELQFADITHVEQLGTDGLKLIIHADYTHTEPGGLLKTLRIDDRSSDIDAKIKWPVIRTRLVNFYTDADLKYTQSTSDFLVNTTIFKDKVYGLTFGGEFDANDALRGVNSLQVHMTQGLPILNASKSSDMLISRPNARPDFTRLNVDYARVQDLFSQFSLLFSVSGQVADTVLYTSQTFGIGNSPYGGAYDQSEIIGDDGLAGKLELRYLISKDQIPGNLAYKPTTQLYVYYDGGEVWGATHEAPGRQSLTSIGTGARFTFTQHLDGYVEYAAPLTNAIAAEETVGRGRQGRIFVGVTGHI